MSAAEGYINIAGFTEECVEALFPRIRARYEDKLIAVWSLPEAWVIAGLSLRIYRLFREVDALNTAGLFEESKATMRPLLKSFINMAYISYSGEKHPRETKSAHELAEMFMAYGDIAYYKLINSAAGNYSRAFKRQHSWSDAELECHRAECKRKRDAARALGCDDRCWHQIGIGELTKRTLEHVPPYVNEDIFILLTASNVSGNSAVHGDSLSIRTQYKDLGARPFEFISKKDESNVGVASTVVLWSWNCLASFFNDFEWLKATLSGIVQDVALDRFEPSSSVNSPRILIPGEAQPYSGP